MKVCQLYLVVGFLIFLSQLLTSYAERYLISSQSDFDRLKTNTFQPKDVILFKKGVRFTGMFSPEGKGISGSPIRIDVYGQGHQPRIDAKGKERAGLLLRNPSFWEVNGLEITNSNGTDDDQGELFGIYVLADKREGIYEHVYINNCYIHNVNGKVGGKKRGGIHVHIKKLKKSIFHDLRITNNRICHVGGVGIGNSSSCGKIEFRKADEIGHYLWTDVYVADNYVNFTGRNNIIARVILWLIVADIALVIAFFVSTQMESRFNSMKPMVMLVKVESIVVGLMPITIVLIHLSNTIIAMIIYGFVEL